MSSLFVLVRLFLITLMLAGCTPFQFAEGLAKIYGPASNGARDKAIYNVRNGSRIGWAKVLASCEKSASNFNNEVVIESNAAFSMYTEGLFMGSYFDPYSINYHIGPIKEFERFVRYSHPGDSTDKYDYKVEFFITRLSENENYRLDEIWLEVSDQSGNFHVKSYPVFYQYEMALYGQDGFFMCKDIEGGSLKKYKLDYVFPKLGDLFKRFDVNPVKIKRPYRSKTAQ